ncbi:hypothetical protein BGZ94_004807, partial [Podila epigama]
MTVPTSTSALPHPQGPSSTGSTGSTAASTPSTTTNGHPTPSTSSSASSTPAHTRPVSMIEGDDHHPELDDFVKGFYDGGGFSDVDNRVW